MSGTAAVRAEGRERSGSRREVTNHDGACIHELIAMRASSHPNRIAVEDAEGILTYAELNERANRLAHVLRARGIGPGQLVAILFGRSREAVAAILGVLKSGAGYVPIEPSTTDAGGGPSSRLELILEDAAASALLTHSKLIEQLPELARRQPLVVDDCELIANAPADELGKVASPDNPAYAIYTSGSTGRPKAVLVPHRAAVQLWSALSAEVYADHAAAPLRVSLNAPLSFDPSVQQLLALVDGHTLVVVPHEVRADGQALLDFVDRNMVDVWDCTPAQLRLLVAAGLLQGERERPKLILCGGEPVDEPTWLAVGSAAHPAVFNLYGPTECTVDSTLARVEGLRPNIGRPIAGARVYIVDEHLAPVPDGASGELCIAGAGVADGYLHRAELTAERFVANPFDPQGGRMYRTGDMGRRREDGAIEFLGRTDDQVKLRGYRIELGEVAAALCRSPVISEAVAVINRDDEPRLVAYYVPSGADDLTGSVLRALLRPWLPPYMIPSIFVAMERLPLTASGKVDRRALPSPPRSRPDAQATFLAPRNQLERDLATIWERVLNLDPGEVGVRDDFFDDLGGDSLRAVELMDAIECLIADELPIDFAVAAPTIEEQAAGLQVSASER